VTAGRGGICSRSSLRVGLKKQGWQCDIIKFDCWRVFETPSSGRSTHSVRLVEGPRSLPTNYLCQKSEFNVDLLYDFGLWRTVLLYSGAIFRAKNFPTPLYLRPKNLHCIAETSLVSSCPFEQGSTKISDANSTSQKISACGTISLWRSGGTRSRAVLLDIPVLKIAILGP
jgi:hypothetical protein